MSSPHLPNQLRHRIKLLRHFLSMERKGNPGRMPNLQLVLRGFLSNRAWLYPFDRFDPELFLTDLEVEARLPRLNTPKAQALLGNKQRFHDWVGNSAFPGRCPELIGYAQHGNAWAYDGHALIEQDIAGRSIIAKPVGGSGGRGVRRIASLAEIDGPELYLLEAAVPQHGYAAAIYPHSVNTVRMLVGVERARGKTVLLGAAHRFGTQKSRPTDNFKAGGIVSLIDLETGLLSAAISNSEGSKRTMHSHHPETGGAIEGVKVPHWEQVKVTAIACTRAVEGLFYVGWDIAVTEEGPVIIEGNAALANPNLIQFHQPMLLRPEVQAFFAAEGVISRRRLRRVEELSSRPASNQSAP